MPSVLDTIYDEGKSQLLLYYSWAALNRARGSAYGMHPFSGLLKGGDAGLGDGDIIFGGATGSDCTDTTAVHHNRKATRNRHKRTRPRCQRDGDRVMIITFISAWAFFSRRKTRQRSAASFGL